MNTFVDIIAITIFGNKQFHTRKETFCAAHALLYLRLIYLLVQFYLVTNYSYLTEVLLFLWFMLNYLIDRTQITN